jgi:ribonuclease HI
VLQSQVDTHRGINKLRYNYETIYTDGGARGNPGPAAIGAVVGDKEYAESIGKATNNIAEYKAVIFALKKAKQRIGKEKAKETELKINSDSELMVNQLNGAYQIKNSNIGELFIKIWNKKQDFKNVTFAHIPREKNQHADALVNKILNKQKLL